MTENPLDTSFKNRIGQEFNRLNRDILVADQPEAWQPAIAAMAAFVAQLEHLLASQPELVGNNLPFPHASLASCSQLRQQPHRGDWNSTKEKMTKAGLTSS